MQPDTPNSEEQRQPRPSWPIIEGSYIIGDPAAPVAICTLTSDELLVPLAMIAVIGTLAWEFQVTLPLMASQVFHGGAASYGVMASVMGGGAVVGGLISAARGRPRARALCLAAIDFPSMAEKVAKEALERSKGRV